MIRTHVTRALLAATTLLALAGCPVPNTVDVTGQWVGTILVHVDGYDYSGTVSFNLVQSGNQVSGTWSSDFDEDQLDNGGVVMGTVSGDKLTATLEPSDSAWCPFYAVSTIDGDTMEGTYTAFDCTETQTGEGILQRVSD